MKAAASGGGGSMEIFEATNNDTFLLRDKYDEGRVKSPIESEKNVTTSW